MSSLLQRALRGDLVERTPVWLMRQAGRYMQEYRELRQRVSFLELCGDADLACEVTLQPLRRFPLDAAIVFSDILTVAPAVGREVLFDKGHGPRIPDPVRTAADVRSLRRPDVADALPVAADTIRRFRHLRPDVPILGFAGAPFTLLCYLVEGGGSKEWEHPKRLLWSDPDSAKRLLDLLADVVGDHLQHQIDAGAVAVQIFDTWAGILSDEDYRAWALPSVQRALSRVSGAPRIYYTKDNGPRLHLLRETGADVFSLDWRVDMGLARRVLGDATPVQGNLDPVLLFAPEETLRTRVRALVQAAGPRGYVFNLGHGILPNTPVSAVDVLLDEVRVSSATRGP